MEHLYLWPTNPAASLLALWVISQVFFYFARAPMHRAFRGVSRLLGGNYRDTIKPYGQEAPGLSAFRKGDDGAIYRTYSTYARGLDVLNGTYHLLDMTSKGRDEDPKHPMAWVRRHDSY